MDNSSNRNLKDGLTTQIAELEKIAKYFEQPEIDLDEGLKRYEQGMKLAKEIRAKLHSYELKITEIKKKYEGN